MWPRGTERLSDAFQRPSIPPRWAFRETGVSCGRNRVRKRRLVCTITNNDKAPPGIANNHAYAILGYDVHERHVKVFNPRGNNFTPNGPPGTANGYATKNGRFNVPLDQFQKVFSDVLYETDRPLPKRSSQRRLEHSSLIDVGGASVRRTSRCDRRALPQIERSGLRSAARLSSGAKCRPAKPSRNRDGARSGNCTRRPIAPEVQARQGLRRPSLGQFVQRPWVAAPANRFVSLPLQER